MAAHPSKAIVVTAIRLRVIDAFTEHPFAGNPAGVCLLESGSWPLELWMRQVAAELNLSETAFARPLPDNREADWALRWFTTVVEDDLCGHATLATAHAIRADTDSSRAIRFLTRSGILVAHLAQNGAVTLDFPAARTTEVEPPEGLSDALGASPSATLTTGALRDLLVVFDDEERVRALSPNLNAVAEITRRNRIRGLTATAPCARPNESYDFVSRFFSPADGIPEDPVTGSAHTALAPYWAARLERDHLAGFQASARGGIVRVASVGDRVYLTGHAVTVLDGMLLPGPAYS